MCIFVIKLEHYVIDQAVACLNSHTFIIWFFLVT